jgi:hypothetical protein
MPFYDDTSLGVLHKYSQWCYPASGIQLDPINLDPSNPQPSS